MNMESGVLVLLFGHLAIAKISLDQPTGVYLETENVTMTCTYQTSYSDKTFYVYKDGQYFNGYRITTPDISATFSFAANGNGGYFVCYCEGVHDQITSTVSESVRVTIADTLTKPNAVLDQSTSVYVRGETLTITCTVTGDNREKYFNFYKDEHFLYRRQIDINGNIGIFCVMDTRNEGRYACRYVIVVGGRQLISPMSETVEVMISDPLAKPRAVLDQSTGVYVRGETLSITCSVTGDNRDKYFKFYKDKQYLYFPQIDRNGNIARFWVTDRRSEGRYACQYDISVGGRRLISPMSETVEVTISDPLAKPMAVLDQWTGVYIRGETLTITCTVTGDNREKYFNVYKDKQRLSSSQIDRTDNIGKFQHIVGRREGQYACQYEISVLGRQLISPLSDTVRVTISDPPATPEVSLDQRTGVYVPGEQVTITCTATVDHQSTKFFIHKETRQIYYQNVVTVGNSGTFRVTGKEQGGRYKCKYRTAVKQREIWSKFSKAVSVTITDKLTPPRILFSQSSGVYMEGETVTMTCSVGVENPRLIYFYKDGLKLPSEVVTKNNSRTFIMSSKDQEGRYQCSYKTNVNGRSFQSQSSLSLTVIISDLHKPHLTVNFDGVAEGGDITFNCTSPLERPGIAFYLYRHEKPTLVSVKPPDEDRHAVTFPIKNIDHSKIGNYTCQYIANISGRNLSSPHSDPVSITVIESKSIAPIAAGVGSAAGLILILALLGACLCRKGKRKENRDTRYTVSPDDQSNEPVTYAVLNLQSQPKSNRAQRQRDIAQAQSDESTLYATVKL
ncbi:uncharacterized protein LOC119960746 isoform X2 [Scyliorhinus canicula]|uniref:uncharacterized protein LOC119960746 isoform X2 n=1 Tax=Scyliorhinus canicula TaxID=7830 RepID=UPI0018F50758|nr:uncharacterized protein LOC119960746 isoform X2 [Scyliorhinus canicula]